MEQDRHGSQHFTFTDIQEAVENLPGLSMEYRQIESGVQEITFDLTSAGQISLSRFVLRTGVEGVGVARAGRLALSLCTSGSAANVNGLKRNPGQFIFKLPGDPADQIYHSNFSAWLFDLPLPLVERHLNTPLMRDRCEGGVFEDPTVAMLLPKFQKLMIDQQVPRRYLEDVLAGWIANLVPMDPVLDLPGNHSSRFRLLQKARELIHDSREQLTQGELCSALSISGRTLRRVFFEYYGHGPAYYYQVVRLNRLRRKLLQMPHERGAVKKAATEQHFWHMGRMSRHYKRLFGESPSETLKRAR